MKISRTLVTAALLLRFGMLFLPAFSTDTTRFLADGINLLNAENPYMAAPPFAIAYAHLRSFYTPLMEFFFAAAAMLWQSPVVFRLLGGLAELVFLGWFFARKQHRPLPRLLVLFLLFNPVSLHEIWREGHLDHIAAFFLYFSIVNVKPALAQKRGLSRALPFAALSIGWKFVGVLSILFRLQRGAATPFLRSVRRVFSVFTLFCLIIFALQLVPAYFFTPFVERGLTVYTTYWHHGNGIVLMFSAFGFADAHGVWLTQRFILLIMLILMAAYLLRRLAYTEALVLALGSLLVFFPVQHPWYWFLLWPLILLLPRWRNTLMLLCMLSPLSYLGYTADFKSIGFVITSGVWLVAVYRRQIGFTGQGGYRQRRTDQ